MNDKTRKMVMTKAIEMYVSLAIAVDEAGGRGFSPEELQEMTVMDLFNSLATNGVRFVYDGPNKKVKLRDTDSPNPDHLVTVEYAKRVVNAVIKKLEYSRAKAKDAESIVDVIDLPIHYLVTFLGKHVKGTFKI